MDDLDVHPGPARELDRLLDRIEDGVGFVAQMGEVAGAPALEHTAEGDELLPLGIGAGRGEQPGRHAERAGGERLFEQGRHPGELVRLGRAVLHPHGHQAERVVPDQHRPVDRGRGIGSHVIGEAGLREVEPRRARAQILPQRLRLAGQRRRAGIAAMADDLGGHPLADLALRQRHQRERPVRMGLDVDEAGGDDLAGGVDCRRAAGGKLADRPDAAGLDGDIGHPPGRARAVDHGAAADDDGVSHRRGASAALRCRHRASPGPLPTGPARRPIGRFRAPARRGSRSRTPHGRCRRIRARI